MIKIKTSVTWSLLAVLALSSGGCAVRTNANGAYQFGLDDAALLGTSVGTFKMQDGSTATLRVLATNPLSPQYSIKLEKFLKVIPLGTAQRMRLDDAQQVGDRTVAVITRYESSCVRTQLLSIKGSEVLAWTVNYQDCRSEPSVRVDGDRLYLLYGQSQFIYRDAKLTRETLPVGALPTPTLLTQPAPLRATPSTASTSVANGRVPPAADVLLPPAPPKLGPDAMVEPLEPKKVAPVRNEQTKQATKMPPRASAHAATTPPKPLEFKQQEQQPVRIILE